MASRGDWGGWHLGVHVMLCSMAEGGLQGTKNQHTWSNTGKRSFLQCEGQFCLKNKHPLLFSETFLDILRLSFVPMTNETLLVQAALNCQGCQDSKLIFWARKMSWLQIGFSGRHMLIGILAKKNGVLVPCSLVLWDFFVLKAVCNTHIGLFWVFERSLWNSSNICGCYSIVEVYFQEANTCQMFTNKETLNYISSPWSFLPFISIVAIFPMEQQQLCSGGENCNSGISWLGNPTRHFAL